MKMSDLDYFAHPGVSNSKLSLINYKQGGSQVKYTMGFDEEKAYRKSLETGTNIHLAILEPSRYIVSETIKPSGKVGPVMERIIHHRKQMSILDSINKACEEVDYGQSYMLKTRLDKLKSGWEYYKFLRKANDMICMSEDVFEAVTKAVESLRANQEATTLLNPMERDVFNEHAYFKEYALQIPVSGMDFPMPTTLTLKCKIDNWSIDYVNKIVTLNDLKSTSNSIDLFDGYLEEYPVPRYVVGSFQKWHYYRQMAFYLDILASHVQKHYGKGYIFECNMIVVETRPPYQSRVFPVSRETLEYGRKEYQRLLIEVGKVEALGAEDVKIQPI